MGEWRAAAQRGAGADGAARAIITFCTSGSRDIAGDRTLGYYRAGQTRRSAREKARATTGNAGGRQWRRICRRIRRRRAAALEGWQRGACVRSQGRADNRLRADSSNRSVGALGLRVTSHFALRAPARPRCVIAPAGERAATARGRARVASQAEMRTGLRARMASLLAHVCSVARPRRIAQQRLPPSIAWPEGPPARTGCARA